ncbi:hypothetical protein POJ06DRAFT_256278 [Lipomyces tetrasporus]|uniref:RING-type domain-containing protein n=1 Tax=Lipomyces tetrasporus TaxID=54092 RepID=A0AAD7QPH1_9ASCO|nr:uncharacterized protein POJ06DRAFT_256278 [Lipomyces tetrasporus]KAJ8099192.1 hypothetical protein POJ06DRAFT_256278 [Lipomyces tetrasporus]
MEQTVERLQAELRHKNELLAVYEKGFANLQRNYTCTVCDNLMFEPCVIACGHSFCYSCLLEWFRRHKTCPSCRLRVSARPTISFQIKDNVDSLVDKLELVAPTEDKKAVRKRQKEQRDLAVTHKRRHGEIFPEMFGPIIEDTYEDDEDGVRRCARCHWELESESGRCLRCYSWQFSDDESLDGLGSLTEEEDGYDFNSEDEDDIIRAIGEYVDMWNSDDDNVVPVQMHRHTRIPQVNVVDSDDEADSGHNSWRTRHRDVVYLDDGDEDHEEDEEDEEEDEDDRRFIDDRSIHELSEDSDDLSAVDHDENSSNFSVQARYYDSDCELQRDEDDDYEGDGDNVDDSDGEADVDDDSGSILFGEVSWPLRAGSNSNSRQLEQQETHYDKSSDNRNESGYDPGEGATSGGGGNSLSDAEASDARDSFIEGTTDGGEEVGFPDSPLPKRARYSRDNNPLWPNGPASSQRERRRIGLQRLQRRRESRNL